MSATCQQMPGRLETYRITVNDGDITLGYLRLDIPSKKWIARTPGSARRAADLKRFLEKDAAVAWLQAREK